MTERKKKTQQIVSNSQISAPEILNEPMALGEVFMQSGMFTDIKTQAQAVVKIIAGKELGISPIEAMSNIYIVNGKVAVMSKIVGSLIKKSPKYDYSVDILTEEECKISFYNIENKERVKIGESIFNKKDAARAGLINRDTYKAYPRNMLFARALSNGARWFCSDVFCGYTPEDLEELTPNNTTTTITLNEDGQVEKEVNNGTEETQRLSE